MKRYVSLPLLFVCSTACSLTATMVPVEGPLSELRPVPVIYAKADGVAGRTGKLTFLMPGDDECEGRWSSVAGESVSVGGANLISQYGAAHLSSYALTSGQSRGAALAVCASGRSFELDFLSNGGHGFGIGKDNEGNIYRFVF